MQRQQGKLYLNPEAPQVALQLLWVLKVNGVETKLSGTLQIQRAVIYKDAALGLSLRNFESDAEDGRLGLARMDVAGAEEDLEIATKMKGFNAVFVQFERFVVDGADKVFAGVCDCVEDFSGTRKRARLREHECRELFPREGARAVEESAVQIFFERDLAAIECREGKFMAVGEFIPIEMESFRRFLARAAIPAVG